MNNAKETLVQAFDNINNIVEYKAEWENGTGYLDNAVFDTTINFDENGYAKSVTAKGRKVVLVKTKFGNAVVFERYTDPDSSIVVSNLPRKITSLLMISNNLQTQQVTDLVGNPKHSSIIPNIGQRLDSLFQ